MAKDYRLPNAKSASLMSTSCETLTVVGTVKWFDAVRGFGFITSEAFTGDILLHQNVLHAFGQSAVSEASLIEETVQDTRKGWQAVDIISLKAPECPTKNGAQNDFNTHFNTQSTMTSPLEAARIKWYDTSKGFGFANVFGKKEDVFVHADIVRRYGLGGLQPGEAICLRVINSARGKLATEIRKWEDYIS